jgi:hypothetical protein
MANSKKAAVGAGCAVVLWLFSTAPRADQTPDPGFNLEDFHRRVRAGTFETAIIQSPVCVKGTGISGQFIMTTSEQKGFPLSVTTVVDPAGAKSFVTSTVSISSAVLSEVAHILNEEAKQIVEKIMLNCRTSEA